MIENDSGKDSSVVLNPISVQSLQSFEGSNQEHFVGTATNSHQLMIIDGKSKIAWSRRSTDCNQYYKENLNCISLIYFIVYLLPDEVKTKGMINVDFAIVVVSI